MRVPRLASATGGRLLAWGYRRSLHPVRWVQRRFTPAGLLVIVATGLTGATASPGHTMGLAVALFLMALLAGGWLTAHLAARGPGGPRGLSVRRRHPVRVMAGEAFALDVTLRHSGRGPQRGLDYLETLHETPPAPAVIVRHLQRQMLARRQRVGPSALSLLPARNPAVPVPDLAGGEDVTITVPITAWRRGRLVLGRPCLGVGDPCRLLRALVPASVLPGPQPPAILVLPRRFALPAFTLPGGHRYQPGGTALAGGTGDSDEFTALRDYRRGDPLKRVHWRSTARTGQLVVKEFADEWTVRHALVLDTTCPAGAEDRFEEAVAVAASFVLTLPDQDTLVDLLLVAPTPAHLASGPGPGNGQDRSVALLDHLAAIAPQRTPHHAELAALVAQHQGSMGGCVLVLLAWDESRQALVRQLRVAQVPTLVLVVLAPGAPAPEVADADRPDRLVVLTCGAIGDGLARLADGAAP